MIINLVKIFYTYISSFYDWINCTYCFSSKRLWWSNRFLLEFVRPPEEHHYGIVAVFKASYENLWDLVEFNEHHPIAKRISDTPNFIFG